MLAGIETIAWSGLNAARTQLAVAAHNTANLTTDGFTADRVGLSSQPHGGVRADIVSTEAPADLLTETLATRLATYGFQANLAVLKTAQRMTGTLIDLLA